MMREELDIPMPRMAPAEPGYRVPRSRAAIDPATKRLAMIGGGIAGVLLLIGGAWSLSGHGTGEVPVVVAATTPLRTRPAQAGGMQVDGQNDAILSGAADGQTNLAPPPETPDPQALKAQAAAPPPAAPALAAPAPAPAIVAAAPPPAAARPVAVASAPKAMPAPAAPAATATALGGHAAVQLAALTSEQLALTEWQRLAHKMPDLLDGRRPVVQKTESHGKTFWRLRTGGFADIAEATQFCQEVRAKGGGCSLARF